MSAIVGLPGDDPGFMRQGADGRKRDSAVYFLSVGVFFSRRGSGSGRPTTEQLLDLNQTKNRDPFAMLFSQRTELFLNGRQRCV